MRSLFAHQAWADAAMLSAVRAHPAAAADETLRTAFHHVCLVQRYYLSLFLDRPFDLEAERLVPESLDDLVSRFRETGREQCAFVDSLDQAGLERVLEMTRLPGVRPSVEEALFQVVMHSQGHRAQCAARLRTLGGTPPTTDFVLWLKDRPQPAW